MILRLFSRIIIVLSIIFMLGSMLGCKEEEESIDQMELSYSYSDFTLTDVLYI